MIRDSNGQPLAKRVRQSANGRWGRTVWFGGLNGLGTNVRRYYYRTHRAALAGDISDAIGRRGRIG